VKDFEPHDALTAAEDGTSDLKTIIFGAKSRLAPGGLLAMETGIRQHTTLLEWCQQAGLARAESKQDLTDRERYVFAWAE
jgi:release factor glutamine methyltransferase